MQITMIGVYGPWMAALAGDDPARLSFRRKEWTDVKAWRGAAHQRVLECLAMPDVGGVPEATVHDQYTYDGLHVGALSWQLPYGPPAQAHLRVIHRYLEGRLERRPSDLELCLWIRFCYNREFYAEAVALFPYVDETRVAPEEYRQVRKIVEVCRLKIKV